MVSREGPMRFARRDAIEPESDRAGRWDAGRAAPRPHHQVPL